MKSYPKLIAALAFTAATSSALGTVYFENTGTTAGWDTVYTQQIGKITVVNSPVYRGSTAIAFEQTWNNVMTGYHSEVIKRTTQSEGQDRYYGKVIRLPSDWYWENDNYTFSQWSPENPEGPWCLQFIQNQDMRIQNKVAGGIANLGAISRGVWIRVVVRLRMTTTGIQEVWVNGVKKLSASGSVQVPGTTIRWSNGIYCTGWRDTVPPTAARYRVIYQDHFRVASSYTEAEPESWGGASAVTFYSSVNYSGTASQPLAKGTYTMSQLAALGVANDSASSVRIPAGWTVTIYQNNDFGGTSWVRTSDTPDFTAISGLNDAMSSCRIE